MTWLLIILAVALVLGPVLYLKPTPKDKRLTALRLKARAKGLSVSLTRIPKLNPEPEERVTAGGATLTPSLACAAYQLAHEVDALATLKPVRILRTPDAPTVPTKPVFESWCTTPDEFELWLALRSELERSGLLADFQATLAALPQSVIGWGSDSRFLSCYWLENAPENTHLIDEIHDGLRRFRERLEG